MLRLDLTASAPRWVEVAGGVRLHCMPLDTEVILRARRAMGSEDDVTPVELRLARRVAAEIVTDWEGVGDAAGRVIKPTPENIAKLLNIPPIFERFMEQVVAPAMLLASEKNVSAPLPNGSAAGVKATVRGARPAARSVRKK